MIQRLLWLGDSRKCIQELPPSAQQQAGTELLSIQKGEQPHDAKPMPAIGKGVEEIRIWVEEGTFRVIYIARLQEAVYVLHVFQKKTQQTSQKDLRLARGRLERLLRERSQWKNL